MLAIFASCYGNCFGPAGIDFKGWFVAVVLLIVYFGAIIQANEYYEKGEKGQAYFMYLVLFLLLILAFIAVIQEYY